MAKLGDEMKGQNASYLNLPKQTQTAIVVGTISFEMFRINKIFFVIESKKNG